MPKDEKVDNKVSRIIKLEEREKKNSKIIQQTNQRNLMSKKEISENENSRLISLAKLEWQKLKLLLCPDEELTIPEFEIYSSICSKPSSPFLKGDTGGFTSPNNS